MIKPLRYNAGNAAQVFLAMYGAAFNDEVRRLILPSLVKLLNDAYECGKRDGADPER